MKVFWGILIPFFGTSLGAACVFLMKETLSDKVQRALTGFAAGVMVAASVWSLLIPAIEQSENLGAFSFLPAFIGFWLGILFLLALDHIIPHLHMNSEQAEGPRSQLRRTTMMVLAVTLHNIPEGMAVGVIYAGFLAGDMQITAASAFALSLGIAIQNFPEGAIISLPLRAEGEKQGISRRSSFRCCRADRSCTDTGCGTVDSASASLFTQFCCRSDALCSNRRDDTGNVTGKAFEYRNALFCCGIQHYDDAGCSVGITNLQT